MKNPSFFTFGGFTFLIFMSPDILLCFTFFLFFVYFFLLNTFFTFYFTFHGCIYFSFLLVEYFTVSLCLVSVTLYLFTTTTKKTYHHVSRVFALVSTKTCIWCC